MSPNHWHAHRRPLAFSLIEMVAVMAVLVILAVAGISLVHGTAAQSRKAAMDLLAGMLEQARTAAITSRSYVVLAVAVPGDLPTGDASCRVGLFTVETWPDAASAMVQGVQLTRWRTLDRGIVLLGGGVDGADNPMDGAPLTISDGAASPRILAVHALAFTPRGALHYPTGSLPVAVRVAEGGYQAGQATPLRRGAGGIPESRLQVSRLTAHSYRTDG